MAARSPQEPGAPTAWLCIALLPIITLLTYVPAWHLGFVNFDDPGWVTANPAVQRGLCPASIHYAFTTIDMGSYNPLTWLSLEADVSLFGVNAAAMHGENVLLHAVNTVLVFLILRQMRVRPAIATVAAAIFGVHPLHVESVAWVTERKDVLCALFFLLAVHGYLRSSRWVPLWFALSLLAKPMTVTLPAVLLLLDWFSARLEASGPLSLWDRVRVRVISGATTHFSASNHPHPLPEGEGTGRASQCRLQVLMLWGMAIAAGVGAVLAQHAGGELANTAAVPLGARVANAVVAYAGYLLHFLWPMRLAAFYPYRYWPAGVVGGCLVVLLGITWLTRPRPGLLLGWLWFLIMLLPTIGLVQVGGQAMADRYMYLPMIGLLIMGSACVAERPRGMVLTGGSALVLILAALTVRQIGFWQNTQTLFRHTLAVTGPNAIAHVQLGLDDAGSGHVNAAASEYQQAIAVDPNYFVPEFDLGNLLLRGDPASAAAHYARAASLHPGSAKIETNWGLALLETNHPLEAEPHFERATASDPNDADAAKNLRLARAMLQRSAAARH